MKFKQGDVVVQKDNIIHKYRILSVGDNQVMIRFIPQEGQISFNTVYYTPEFIRRFKKFSRYIQRGGNI